MIIAFKKLFFNRKKTVLVSVVHLIILKNNKSKHHFKFQSHSGDEVAGAWKESPECKKFLSKKGFNDTSTLKRYFAHFMANLANDEGLHTAAWADALIEENAPYNISAFPTKQ